MVLYIFCIVFFQVIIAKWLDDVRTAGCYVATACGFGREPIHCRRDRSTSGWIPMAGRCALTLALFVHSLLMFVFIMGDFPLTLLTSLCWDGELLMCPLWWIIYTFHFHFHNFIFSFFVRYLHVLWNQKAFFWVIHDLMTSQYLVSFVLQYDLV